MFITDETNNSKSHVTFYRCSICVSEHVSSEAISETVSQESGSYFNAPSTDRNRHLMV